MLVVIGADYFFDFALPSVLIRFLPKDSKVTSNGVGIKAVLDNLRDVQILYATDGEKILYVNQAVRSVYGIAPEELQARPQLRFECVHRHDLAALRDRFNLLTTQRIPLKLEYRITTADGRQVWVDEDSRVVTREDGQQVLLVSIHSDGVTERHVQLQNMKVQYSVAQVLADLDNPHAALQRALEIIGTELDWQICEYWVPTDDQTQLQLSQGWYNASACDARKYLEITRGLHLDSVQLLHEKAWLGGQPLWTQTVLDMEPPQRRYASEVLGLKTGLSFPVKIGTIKSGVVALYSLEAHEIDTGLLQTVDSLGAHLAQYVQRFRLLDNYTASESRFRQMFEQSEVVKLVVDPVNGAIVDANPAAARFYGYAAEQLRQMRIWQINTLPPHEVHARLNSASIDERSHFIFNHRLANGSIRQVEVHSSPVSIAGRALLYSTIFDMTDKIKTEAALRESDERIRLLFKHTPTAIAIFDRQLRYLFATTAWISDHRLKAHNVIGHSHLEFFPSTSDDWIRIFNRALAGETFENFEQEIHFPDGTVDWVRCAVSPWRKGEDEIGGIIVSTESITKEKLARDTLLESEAKYRSLFENLIDGFAFHKIILDCDGQPVDYVFLEANSAFEQMTGLKRANLIGRTVTEVIPGIEDSAEDWISTYGRVALTGETARFEREAPQLGRWFSVAAYSPKREYFVTVFEDITERKRVEAELREHQRTISTLLSNLPGMAYRCRNDRDWTMDYISEGCAELTGYRPPELLPGGLRTFNDLIHPDDRDFIWSEVQRALNSRSAFQVTYRLFTKSGQLKWVWEQGSGIQDEAGNVASIEGFIADISDRKSAEDALISREEHFRALIDNSSDVINLLDVDGHILYGSPSLERVLGYSPEELQGANVFHYIHRHDRLRARATMRRALVNGVDISLELRIRHKDRSWRILDVVGRNLLDDPHVNAIVVNSRDITERRMIETERSQLAKAVEQATESIVITDLRANIVYVNSAFEKVSGYSREEVTGKNVRLLKSGEQSAEYYHDLWATLKAGEPWVGRFKNRRKNGTLYEEECAISPIKDSDGTVINFVAVKRDVTKEVELEDRLRQAQKLEAVGRLASGIAHDFNNLLAGIRGFGELISQEADEDSKLRDYSDEIIRAASRAADLTSQLLAFARKGNYLSVPVDIHATIQEVTSILKHTIDRRIEIRTEFNAREAVVKGDPSQIQSAILNLAVNSRDAMPEGGRLTFATCITTLDGDYCRRHSLDRGPGEYLALMVSDTGMGIEESNLSHIFDPFFTTKEQGQGTGLGLAGVYGCVRNHQGSVEVVSQVGQGSTFTLYLPVITAANLPTMPEVTEAVPEGRERILVVDDEEIVRNLAERMLVKAGYKVFSCQDGEEAVQLYRTAVNGIDLVLLDMMMPKMNGRDTFAALKKFNPDVKVLLMSGFSDQDVQGILKEGIVGFVHKPFQMRSFLLRVREALDVRTKVKQT